MKFARRLVRILLFQGRLLSVTERTGEPVELTTHDREMIELIYGHRLGTHGQPEDQLIYWGESPPETRQRPRCSGCVPTEAWFEFEPQSCVVLSGPRSAWPY